MPDTDDGSWRFDGDVVLITGLDEPIGAACATYLRAHGASVVDLAALGLPAGGPELGRTSVAEAVIDRVMVKYGALHALVNATGHESHGELSALTDGELSSVFVANVGPAVQLTRAALPAMQRSERGRVVNITSGAGAFGQGGMAGYCAASAAIIGFTRACALDLAHTDVRVNAVAAIVFDGATGSSNGAAEEQTVYDPGLVAPAVGLLAHRRCTLTGRLLSVGGGRVAGVWTSTVVGHYDRAVDHAQLAEQLDKVLATAHPYVLSDATQVRLLIDV